MRQLEESLRRLKTDHLDLWQIHEVAYANDPERHFAKGGVIEALDEAKQKGMVRFVGFTGHKDPALHLEMLSYGYPFDSVPDAPQLLRRHLPQLRAAGAARSAARRASRPSA